MQISRPIGIEKCSRKKKAFFSATERSKGEGKGKEKEEKGRGGKGEWERKIGGFRSCQSFNSNFPFPFSFPSSSFPFLFLSLSFFLRPFVCAKKKTKKKTVLTVHFLMVSPSCQTYSHVSLALFRHNWLGRDVRLFSSKILYRTQTEVFKSN